MPKVHFVKAARKDNPVAKKGESYHWWKPMIGGRGGAKRYSKDRPKPSQLTTSAFQSTYLAITESIDAATDVDGLRSCAEELRELSEEERGKYDNMPEGLQQGDTGQLLDERATGCEEWADQIEQHCDEYDSWEPDTDVDDGGEESEDEDEDIDDGEETDRFQELKDNVNNDAPGL